MLRPRLNGLGEYPYAKDTSHWGRKKGYTSEIAHNINQYGTCRATMTNTKLIVILSIFLILMSSPSVAAETTQRHDYKRYIVVSNSLN